MSTLIKTVAGGGEFGKEEAKPCFYHKLQNQDHVKPCTSMWLFAFLLRLYLVIDKASSSNRSVFFLEINENDFLKFYMLLLLAFFFASNMNLFSNLLISRYDGPQPNIKKELRNYCTGLWLSGLLSWRS